VRRFNKICQKSSLKQHLPKSEAAAIVRDRLTSRVDDHETTDVDILLGNWVEVDAMPGVAAKCTFLGPHAVLVKRLCFRVSDCGANAGAEVETGGGAAR
jgi:hypothetical protein